jgi:toxin secretion/phage lysis holin
LKQYYLTIKNKASRDVFKGEFKVLEVTAVEKQPSELLYYGFDITSVVGNIWYLALAIIVFDVVTGLLAAALERKLNSSVNFIGLIRKVGLFVALAFLVFVDAYVQSQGYLVKIGVGLIVAYEGLSIIENFSRIGIDVKFLTKYFDPNKTGKQK